MEQILITGGAGYIGGRGWSGTKADLSALASKAKDLSGLIPYPQVPWEEHIDKATGAIKNVLRSPLGIAPRGPSRPQQRALSGDLMPDPGPGVQMLGPNW